MSHLGARFSSQATSAGGAMIMSHVRNVMLGSLLTGLGTSSALAFPDDTNMAPSHFRESTNVGATIAVKLPSGRAISELRRLSGLTWDQLARLFNVSRRSLHFWASGKPMTANNEEQLQLILAVVRNIDRGSSSGNRAVLLSALDDGQVVLDLLAAGRYDIVLNHLARENMPRNNARMVTAAAVNDRVPRDPSRLVDALQDRVHPASGRLLSARALDTRREK